MLQGFTGQTIHGFQSQPVKPFDLGVPHTLRKFQLATQPTVDRMDKGMHAYRSKFNNNVESVHEKG